MRRKKGSGSVFRERREEGQRWVAVAPRKPCGARQVVGAYGTRREAEKALEGWLADREVTGSAAIFSTLWRKLEKMTGQG